MPRNQLNFEAVAVSTSAVSLTTPGYAKHVMIRVTGAPVRWRADGTAPTSTVGMYAGIGQYIEFMDDEEDQRGLIKNIQFIRDTSAGADASLEVAYFD